MSELNEAEVYTRMIESIKTAAGCAQQLAHMRQDERWLKIRSMLETSVDRITALAMRRAA